MEVNKTVVHAISTDSIDFESQSLDTDVETKIKEYVGNNIIIDTLYTNRMDEGSPTSIDIEIIPKLETNESSPTPPAESVSSTTASNTNDEPTVDAPERHENKDSPSLAESPLQDIPLRPETIKEGSLNDTQPPSDETITRSQVHIPTPTHTPTTPKVVARVSTSMNVDEDVQKGKLVLNPFHLDMKKKKKQITSLDASAIEETLRTSAVEMYFEFSGLSTGIDIFGTKSECFIVIFEPGSEQGIWQASYKSQLMPTSYKLTCDEGFRLRSATDVDRSERYYVSLFAFEHYSKQDHELIIDHAWVSVDFTVQNVIQSKQMALNKQLRQGRDGMLLPKTSVVMTLDIIHHVLTNRVIELNFGFLQDCQRRNRMFFKLLKAIRTDKWVCIYKSETRYHDNIEQYDIMKINEQQLHSGDTHKMVRLQLHRWYKNGKTILLGFVQTTFEKLLSFKPKDQLYWWPAENGLSTAKVSVKDIQVSDEKISLTLRMANMF